MVIPFTENVRHFGEKGVVVIDDQDGVQEGEVGDLWKRGLLQKRVENL